MLPAGYEKRSFYRFDIGVDLPRLRAELASVADNAWLSSYWGAIHCSVGMLLLRGGWSGTEKDFFCDEVSDNPLLDSLPYMRQIIGSDGPFGEARYAFIFRMRPNGVTLLHQDMMEQWREMFRIHVPIISNPGAHLVAEDHSMHFEPGFAWSFDNMSDHGFVNGDQERIHLIFDIPFNARMKRRIDEAAFLPGVPVPEHNKAIRDQSRAVMSYVGDDALKEGVLTLRSRGLNDAQIATFLNAKRIPTRGYGGSQWTAEILAETVDRGVAAAPG